MKNRRRAIYFSYFVGWRGNVEIQLLACLFTTLQFFKKNIFIYFVFCCFLSSHFLRAARPLGNISIDIIFLLPWACLWLALWAREREEVGGIERTGWFIARNWQLQQFLATHITQQRKGEAKERLAALFFLFLPFWLSRQYFFTDVSVQPPSTSLRSFLSFG